MKVFGAAFAAFVACDLVWLSLTAGSFYKKHIGHLMAETPVWWAALLLYTLFIGGLQLLVIEPALASGTWTTAAWRGAVYGLVTYGTYDLTNLATLKGWPPVVAAVDMAWGAFLAASAASAGYWAGRQG